MFSILHDSWSAFPTFALIDHNMVVRAKPWTLDSNTNSSSCDGSNSTISGWSGGSTSNFIQQLVDECGSLCIPNADTDEDGVANDMDNCPNDSNPDQYDGDTDGFGDACDDCFNSPGNFNAAEELEDGDAFTIDILDIVSMVNVILSSTPTDCELANGDLNGDSIANIQDLIVLVNIILNNGRTIPVEGKANVTYVERGDSIEITIDSDVDFSGVQIMYATDIQGSVELRDNSHIDRHSRYEDGVMRFVGYNMFSNSFDSHRAEFVITGTDLRAQDVLITVSSPTGHEIELSHQIAGEVFQTGAYRFAIGGVYPNPFNPATEVSFTLPSDEHVKLSVYNVNGQEVDVIFEGFQSVGPHQYRWDAGDQPSGVYYIRLMSGTQAETVKAVLMR